MMRAALIAPIAVVAVVAVGAAGAAKAEPLRFGATADYPPYLFTQSDGSYAGIDRLLMDRMCDMGGYDCSVVPMSVAELIPALRAGQIDAIIGGIGNTPERDLLIDFTCPYDNPAAYDGLFYGFANAPLPETARVGVTDQTVHHATLVAAGYNVTPYASAQEGLWAVGRGDVDMYFGAINGVEQYLVGGNAQMIELGRHPLPLSGAAIGVAETNPKLRADLDALLAEISASGDLEQWQNEWLGRSQPDSIALCQTITLTS